MPAFRAYYEGLLRSLDSNLNPTGDMMYDPDETASLVREALHTQAFLDDHAAWNKFVTQAPSTIPQVLKDAADIGSDMLIEAGLFTNEELDLVWQRIHQAFMVGFKNGYAYDPSVGETDDSNNGSYVAAGKTIYRLADGCPEWIFHELMDKAYDCLVELADDPTSPRKKGAYEQAVESLRSILHIDEKDAYWVVLDVTINRNALKKEQ